MKYKGKTITLKRVTNNIHREIKKIPIYNNIYSVLLVYKMKKSLQVKLNEQEITIIYDYWKKIKKNSYKQANKLAIDIINIINNNYLTINLIDIREPKILSKIVNHSIEKEAFLTNNLSNITPHDIKKYSDTRINQQIKMRNKEFQSRKKTFSINLAEKAYQDIKTILDLHNIEFFLISGTLLGAIRNKTFMENDYDIDLGIFEHKTSTTTLKDIFTHLNNGYKIITYNKYVFEIQHKNGVIIEFFTHFIERNAICHRTLIHKWYNTPFLLNNIQFANTTANIPQNYNLYLSENYGNWQDKVSFYDFSFDTPNVQYESSVNSLEYFSKRIIEAIKKGDRRAFYCSNRALKQAFNLDYSKYYPHPTDGDIMDNIEKRQQLFIINIQSTYEEEKFLEKIISYCQGTNINLDIYIIGKKITQYMILEDIKYINQVTIFNSTKEINLTKLTIYDKIVIDSKIENKIFSKYPNISMEFNYDL